MTRSKICSWMFTLWFLNACGTEAQKETETSHVPEPRNLTVKELPAFSTLDRELAKDPLLTGLQFRIDLDLLAPLGKGTKNSADYFKEFAEESGKRSAEIEAAEKRCVPFQAGAEEQKILPPDDPLLLEAEPWADNAVLRFYPEIWQFSVPKLPFPNVRQLNLLGRSWVARGKQAKTTEEGLKDFRRTIRLGRLLLQDDFTILQNLIGLNLIRVGAAAMFDAGKATNNGVMTTLASMVYSDSVAIRAETVRRGQTILIIHSFLGPGETIKLPDERLDDLIKMSSDCPDRSFRCTAMVRLWIVKFLGTQSQKKKATDLLVRLQKHADQTTADFAKYLSSTPWAPKILEDM